MASEEKTSAADIPLKSDEDEELVPWTMASREKTSAASIPLKSHEEVVPWTMAREEIQEGCAADFPVQIRGCSADFPVKSNREGGNQIVGCAADLFVPIDAADLFVPIAGCAADFPVKRDREPTMDRSHAYPQGFNESPPSTCFCTCFPSPTVRTARKENQIDGFTVVGCAEDFPVQIDGCAEDFPVQIDGCAADIPVQSDREIIYRSHEVSLDINEIATSLSKHLNTKKVFSRACCIYRVPARLRKLNKEAYTPRVVSIGPLHHGKKNLKAMEDHKIMYLQQFLDQSEVSVEDLINVVKDNETELRDCYAETIYLSRKDFATMIILDAVFIIMVLLKFNKVGESRKSGSGDQIFERPFKFVDVVWDMCLLENQLPFFLLEKLFELYPTENCTIMELTFELLKTIWANWVKEKINCSGVLHFVDFLRKCQQPTEHKKTEKINLCGVLHFVDLLRKCQQPREHHLPTEKTSFSSAPTAMKLHQSGVKFKNPEKNPERKSLFDIVKFKNPEKNPERKSLFDIRFRHGTLEIPQLIIDDHTEILFRNLQAFEQCHHKMEDKFVSDYIAFISFLVRAPKDVEVLADNENLKNMLNSVEAVSNLVYNLDKENMVSEKSILGGICDELTKHCKKRRYKWMANLKQDYFNNPWTAISVAAAAFLLVLTVIQTVCSILQL